MNDQIRSQVSLFQYTAHGWRRWKYLRLRQREAQPLEFLHQGSLRTCRLVSAESDRYTSSAQSAVRRTNSTFSM